MVHRAGVGEPYIVQLVGFNGVGGPAAHPLSRSSKTFFLTIPCAPNATCADSETAAYDMPETSVSSTRVYFLDGETQVRSLTREGKVVDVKNIQAPPNSQVMFAVSPDDTRMAVAIITLPSTRNGQPFTEKMYVEDASTTSNRVDLYASTTQPEWPVGWHGQSLVVAVGGPDLWGSPGNPYGAKSYTLLDPANGRVQVNLDCAVGQLGPIGTLCVDGGCPDSSRCKATTVSVQWWDGRKVPLPLPPEASYIFTPFDYTQLSPDGSLLAVDAVVDPSKSGDTQTVVSQFGKLVFTTLVGAPQGWLDSEHLIVSNAEAVYIVDVLTRSQVPMTNLQTIPQEGMPSFVDVLPR